MINNRRQLIKAVTLEKGVFYLLIVSGFLGSYLLLFNLGLFSLFPFRILLVLLWFLFLIKLLDTGKLKLSLKKIKFYLLFLIIWLLYAVLSLGWSYSKIDALRYVTFLFSGLSLIFFALYYFSNFKDLKRLYYVWLFSPFIILPLALGPHLTVKRLPHQEISLFHFNANTFAFYLALLLPFLIFFLLFKKKPIYYFILVPLVLFILYLLLATFTRSSYIAVALEFLFLSILFLRTKAKFFLVLISFLLILLMPFFPIKQEKFFYNWQDYKKQVFTFNRDVRLGFVSQTGVLAERANLFKNSFYALIQTFGFGLGAGNFPDYIRYHPHFAYPQRHTVNAHNWWIEIYSEYGVWIFAAYCLFYVKIISSLYKAYQRTKVKDEKMIAAALFLSLVGFFFASMGPSSIMTESPQWILFGFALAFLNYFRQKYEPQRTLRKTI